MDKLGDQKTQTIVSEHNAVAMNPKKAKKFKQLLEKNIERYEEKYGEIEVEDINEETENEEESPETQDYIA